MVKNFRYNRNKIESLPENCGVFNFYKNGQLVYSGFSSNVKHTVNWLFNVSKDNNMKDQFKDISEIEFLPQNSLFKALFEHKKIVLTQKPELQFKARYYDDFVYLAVDFYKFPYFKIENTTQENYFYIGPFKDRFMLYETIQAMSELYKTPYCENDDFPCDKLKNKQCLGYCVEDFSFSQHFGKYFLLTDNTDYLKIIEKINALEDNLEFEKAEEIALRKRIIDKFYDEIKFLIVMKDLNLEIKYDDFFLTIKNGLLYKCRDKLEEIEFPIGELSYRENEKLAIDKSHLMEMKVLYNIIKSQNTKIIDQIYAKRFQSIGTLFL